MLSIKSSISALVLTLAAISPAHAGSVVTNSYQSEHGTVRRSSSGEAANITYRQMDSSSAAFKNEFITPGGVNGYVRYEGRGSASIGHSGVPEVSCSGSMVAQVDPAFMCAVSQERSRETSTTTTNSRFTEDYTGFTQSNSHSVSSDNF